MKPKGYRTYKPKEQLNIYSGAPVNQGFYERNLKKAKKLYIDQYDRLKQQIYKRKQDREFHDILNNYYDDYEKFTKKHKFLKNYEDYNKYKEEQTLDYNQYEFKKKNINALFFKYDNTENDLNFDVTDNIINSMNKGDNMTYLKCLEIKDDYTKRLSENKNIDINEINSANLSTYSKENNECFFIKSDKIKEENNNNTDNNKEQDKLLKANNLNNKEAEIIIEDIDNEKKIDEEAKNESNKIIEEKEEKEKIEEKEVQEDELTRYKKVLKESNYPCLEHLINPFYNTKYIPPTFIQENPIKEENENKEKKESQNSLYNDFENIDENKDKIPSNEALKKDESKNEDNNYEDEKFEEINDNSNKEKEKDHDNDQKINENDLKMLNDIIQDEQYPKFEQIINPYYKTDYQPKDIFPHPVKENEIKDGDENKFSGEFQEIEKGSNNEFQNELKNNDSNKFNNPKIEEIIDNDYKESFVFPNDNESEDKKEGENSVHINNNFNDINYNNNNGTGLVKVEDLINKDFQDNKIKGNEILDKNKDDDEQYNDFLDN